MLRWLLAAAASAMIALPPALAAEPTTDQAAPTWVADRVKEWQPRHEERRFDQIGWAPSLREALKLAKEHNRPVFLFTYDGAECGIETHRC